MSPGSIIDIQRRLHETGRIRIGTSVPAKSRQGKDFRRPVKLDRFLFTSANARALQSLAELYGGKVEPWAEAPGAPQSKVLTETDEIPVLVPPQHMAFSQMYEHWDAGRCMVRCDGRAQIPTGEECTCDPENRRCKPTTRLSLMLPQLLGSGLWRLDTRGYNAAAELSGAFGLAEILAAATGQSVLPGVLRLTQRETKRADADGKTITHSFAVPVIDFDLGPALPTLTAGTTSAAALAPAAPEPSGVHPVAALPAASLADEIANVSQEPQRSTRRNAAEPLKRTGRPPRPRGQVAEPDEGDDEAAPATARTNGNGNGNKMTEPQSRAIFRLLKLHDVDTDELRHSYATATLGRPIVSFTELTVDDASRLIEDLQRDHAEASAS